MTTCIFAHIVLNPTHWPFMAPHTVLCVQCVLILLLSRATVAISPGLQPMSDCGRAHTGALCFGRLRGLPEVLWNLRAKLGHMCAWTSHKRIPPSHCSVCFFLFRESRAPLFFVCEMYGPTVYTVQVLCLESIIHSCSYVIKAYR